MYQIGAQHFIIERLDRISDCFNFKYLVEVYINLFI